MKDSMALRYSLFWRLVAPSLVVSLLLLGLGLGTSLYVYIWNSQVATELGRRLSAVLIANELVLSLRDLRLTAGQYKQNKQPQLLERAYADAQNADRKLTELKTVLGEPAGEPLERLLEGAPILLAGTDPRCAADGLENVNEYVRDELLPAANTIVDDARAAVAEENRQNQRIARLLGMILALWGLCGAVAGLLAGYGVARSVTLSIEQLGGSVMSLAQTLDSNSPDSDTPIQGLRELISTLSVIEDRTAGVVSELELSRDSAARSDQLAAVGHLAAGIAHELRNPLAAVKLLIDSSVERADPLPPEEISVIQQELVRMDYMLRSFLDFARPPKLIRQPTDLSKLISDAIDLIKPRATSQKVMMNCHAEGPIIVSADPQQIKQVALNIMLNSIDAQPQGGRVDVEVCTQTTDNALWGAIRISDEGPGISQAIADSLFEPFVSTKETGVGLGLAISRRIVASHGGRVTCQNRQHGGAVFTVELPLEAPTAH